MHTLKNVLPPRAVLGSNDHKSKVVSLQSEHVGRSQSDAAPAPFSSTPFQSCGWNNEQKVAAQSNIIGRDSKLEERYSSTVERKSKEPSCKEGEFDRCGHSDSDSCNTPSESLSNIFLPEEDILQLIDLVNNKFHKMSIKSEYEFQGQALFECAL